MKKNLIISSLFIFMSSIYGQTAVEHYNVGVESDKNKNFEGAIRAYSEAISLNPKYKKAYVNRAFDKLIVGDAIGAVADLSQAIALDPKLEDAYYYRGNAKYDLGDYHGAISDYTISISLKPNEAGKFYMHQTLVSAAASWTATSRTATSRTAL